MTVSATAAALAAVRAANSLRRAAFAATRATRRSRFFRAVSRRRCVVAARAWERDRRESAARATRAFSTRALSRVRSSCGALSRRRASGVDGGVGFCLVDGGGPSRESRRGRRRSAGGAGAAGGVGGTEKDGVGSRVALAPGCGAPRACARRGRRARRVSPCSPRGARAGAWATASSGACSARGTCPSGLSRQRPRGRRYSRRGATFVTPTAASRGLYARTTKRTGGDAIRRDEGRSRRLEDSVEARGRYYRGGAGKQLRRHSAFLGLDKTLSRRIPRPAVPHRGSSGAHGYVGYGRYFRADSPGRRSARHASRRAFVASSAPRAEKRHARPRVSRRVACTARGDGVARRRPPARRRRHAARRSETSRGALADPSSRLPRLRRASSRRASSRDGRRRAVFHDDDDIPPRAMFDPDSVDDPLLRKAMKEPVAFFGGLFAGFLGLRVDEAGSPLKAWVDAAAEDAGVPRRGRSVRRRGRVAELLRAQRRKRR